MKKLAIPFIVSLTLLSAVVAQHVQSTSSAVAHVSTIHRPDQIKWGPGPASIPPGAKMAMLEGDLAKEGFFTVRLSLPDGYQVPPHTHPAVEHVTVLSGTLNMGMGDKFDKTATVPMPAGTFGYWPAGMKHFAWTQGETVIQVHGIGPWKIEYLNPADDPRNKK